MNVDLSLDYEAINGKGVTDKDVDFTIQECCLRDDRVREIKEIKITKQVKERRTETDILTIDRGQKEIWFKEVVDPG